jgi:hypothetical protein
MRHPLPTLLLLLTLFLGAANAHATNSFRRLLVTSPTLESEQCGVELGSLRSDVDLGNVVSVVDRKGLHVEWKISHARDWVVFDSRPNEAYEILIATNNAAPSQQRTESLPGMLTLSSHGISVIGCNEEARIAWFSNRLSRVAGAFGELEDSDAINHAVPQNLVQLKALGVNGLTPSNPYATERLLVEQEPDFPKLLARMLEAELQARAELFVIARETLRSPQARHRPAEVAQIQPWDLVEDGAAAGLTGRLLFDEDVTFTINIYSLFGGVLRVDGRDVAVIRPALHAEPEGWRKRVPLHLEAGPHDIAFITQGQRQDFQAGMTWVPPGETQERHMTGADFAPAPRARITGFLSADRSGPHPLIRLRRLGRTGFYNRARYWVELESLDGAVEWHVDGHQTHGKRLNICVPADPTIAMGAQGDSFTVRLDKEQFRYLGGEMGIQSELPQFLFRDERLEGHVTLLSEAEIPLDIELTLKRTREGAADDVLLDERIVRPGRGVRGVQRRAPTGRHAFSAPLAGQTFESGDALTLRVACPPELFANRTLRVLTPTECAGASYDNTGRLLNAAGEPILVHLTRPTLSDKRNWGLLRGLFSASPPRNLLVVVAPEEWGNQLFRGALEAEAEKRGLNIHVMPWSKTPTAVSRLLGSIGAVATALQEDTFDGVLFVPPLADLAAGTGPREMSRAMACLAEMSSHRLGRHRVWLALPPAYRPGQSRSQPFESALLRVTGDYGIEPIPLATWLESKPAELAAAYNDASGIMQPGPVAMGEAIAQYFIAWICGDPT